MVEIAPPGANSRIKWKVKRTAKGREKTKDEKGGCTVPGNTITGQSEVSGKLQKYSRIGAREFVSYEQEH